MDQVPGKKLQADASDLDVTCCQPCSLDGATLTAEVYCTVCKEYMCSNCTSVHKKQRITKSHTLLAKSSLPTNMGGFTTNEESQYPCDIHPEECIKYFCPTHQTLNCGHCSVLDHRSCEQQIISEIAKSFKEGQGYNDIKQVIVQIQKDIDACVSDVKDNTKLVEDLGEHEISTIRIFRDQINKYLDEREHTLLNTIAQMKNMNETLLYSLKPSCVNLKTKVNEIKAKLEAQENNSSQLFVEAHIALNVLEGIKSTLAEINKKNVIHHYQFKKDPATEGLLDSRIGLGTIEEMATVYDLDQICERISFTTQDKSGNRNTTYDAATDIQDDGDEPLNPSGSHTSAEPKQKKQIIQSTDLTSLHYTQAPDIQVNFPSDTRNSCLNDMLLLPGDRLLLADTYQAIVMLVDLKTSSLVTEVSVPYVPSRMCLLPGDEVAVSIDSGIQFIEIRGQLSLGKHIYVDGDCCGIGYHADNFFVIFDNGKVKKINMEGKVLKKISNSRLFSNPFKRPEYLTVVSEDQLTAIYVSDFVKSTITKMDMNLNILQTFQDRGLQKAAGMTAVGSKLLICGLCSNNLMCLDLPSGQITQLLGRKEGIETPNRVCYSQQQNKMYVLSDIGFDGDNVKVFTST